MLLYLFTASGWCISPPPAMYLRYKLPIQKVKERLAMGIGARKHRFIGQQALPQEGHLFSRKLPPCASLQNHLPPYASGHTLLHELTGYETQVREWIWQHKMSTSQQRLKEHSLKNHHDYYMGLSLHGREFPTLSMPCSRPSPHARIVIYRLKDLIQITYSGVQN